MFTINLIKKINIYTDLSECHQNKETLSDGVIRYQYEDI